MKVSVGTVVVERGGKTRVEWRELMLKACEQVARTGRLPGESRQEDPQAANVAKLQRRVRSALLYLRSGDTNGEARRLARRELESVAGLCGVVPLKEGEPAHADSA